MPVEIKEVQPTKKDLKHFIKFPFELYKGVKEYVTPLMSFEYSTLMKTENPAFDHCEAKYWLAYRDGKIVGRIAAILLREELETKGLARFGWIDFIDDKEVSAELIRHAEEWAVSKGATNIHGPLGFTDLDFEGALVGGYDQLATQATIYNYPYYIDHFEHLGFKKAVDWIEHRGFVPKEHPKRLERMASVVSKRFGLEVKHFKKTKELLKYAPGVFEVLNAAYSNLYGYYPLSQKQIDYYVKQYFDFIRKEYVTIITNETDQVVAVAISLPSLSKALQKANGSLFPFGFIHVLKAFKSNKHLDLFLIGVLPSYQKMGASVLIFNELFKAYVKNGVEYFSTGPMLEDNSAVQNLWNEYDEILDDSGIRRRCFVKQITA